MNGLCTYRLHGKAGARWREFADFSGQVREATTQWRWRYDGEADGQWITSVNGLGGVETLSRRRCRRRTEAYQVADSAYSGWQLLHCHPVGNDGLFLASRWAVWPGFVRLSVGGGGALYRPTCLFSLYKCVDCWLKLIGDRLCGEGCWSLSLPLSLSLSLESLLTSLTIIALYMLHDSHGQTGRSGAMLVYVSGEAKGRTVSVGKQWNSTGGGQQIEGSC